MNWDVPQERLDDKYNLSMCDSCVLGVKFNKKKWFHSNFMPCFGAKYPLLNPLRVLNPVLVDLLTLSR